MPGAMAQMATCPNVLEEAWLTPPTCQPLHQQPHEDISWMKFEIETTPEENPTAILSLPYTSIENLDTSLTTINAHTQDARYHRAVVGALPTPPNSPFNEPDLDELVASMPEILESPSATPPSEFRDILSDLEGMDATPLGNAGGETPSPRMDGWSDCASWWSPVVNPQVLQGSLKRDIMWGGGTCCPPLMDTPIKKERQVSESSTDITLKDVLTTADDMTDEEELEDEEDDDEERHLPDTPSGTDSDSEDHVTTTSSSCSSSARPPRISGARYNTSTTSATTQTPPTPQHSSCSSPSASPCSTTAAAAVASPLLPQSVKSEHNYCGRVPSDAASSGVFVLSGIVTPSDTEDEVDVVSCGDQNDAGCPLPTPASLTTPTTNTTTTSTQVQVTPISANKRSVDVKRQLQLAIQEAMKNRQNRVATPLAWTPTEGSEASSRLVSIKIKTQGKPAAYTKRMRDYHSEVIKSSKHRRRNRGELDEGRRNVHNSLERQRRVDLRNAFEYLRLLVPDTKVLEKAPKVQILQKAALHCTQLQHTEQRLLREKEKLKAQLEELERRRAACS